MTSQLELQHQLYRCITIKQNLCRDLLNLCQDDLSFVNFYEHLIGFRYFFEDVKTCGAQLYRYTHEDLLEAVQRLVQLRDRTLRDLVSFQWAVQSSSNLEEVHQLAVARLEEAIEILGTQFVIWLEYIDKLLRGLNNIYEILSLKTAIDQIFWFHRNDLRNLINQKEKLDPTNARDFLVDNSKKLQARLQLQVDKTLNLVIMYTNSDQLTPDRVSQALKSLQETAEIAGPTPDDVQQLREHLFPGVQPPLEEQKHVVETEKTVRKRQLGSQLAQMDQIEEKMQQLQMAIDELTSETLRQLEELELVRQQLREGMFELLRLKQLIHAIDEEISLRIQAFQGTLEALDARCLDIDNDPTLSVDEKLALLTTIRAEEDQLRRRHTSQLLALQTQKLEYSKTAKAEAEKMFAVKEQLMTTHRNEVADLERQLLNASPSEALLIQAKIDKLNAEFEEQLVLMERFQQERIHEHDEYGRFYVDADGRKVYQRDSNASEYVLNEAGEWIKVREAVALLSDEKGDYYLDQFNRKVYVKRYFDANGRRIFHPPDDLDQCSEESDDGQEFSAETKDDYWYIKATIGKPLTQGLAHLVLLQPHDPINYLANFLLQYQYNKDRLADRETELQQLLAMRKHLPAEEFSCGLAAKTSALK